MKANTPIHLVRRKNYDALNDSYAFFDSKEKAMQFADKIKYRPDIKITDGILYPDYIVDKTTALYSLPLAQTGSMPKDISRCDHNLNAEDKQEEYNICFYGGTKSSLRLFILKTLVVDQKEALKGAISIRNTAIGKGEWVLARINTGSIIEAKD